MSDIKTTNLRNKLYKCDLNTLGEKFAAVKYQKVLKMKSKTSITLKPIKIFVFF